MVVPSGDQAVYIKCTNQLVPIGKMTDAGTETTVPDFLIEHTKKIIEFCTKNTENIDDFGQIFETDDITSVVIGQLRWRRCTGFMIVQKSDVGIRYLCYLVDVINHPAQCFGTSPNSVSTSQVLEGFKKCVKSMRKIFETSGEELEKAKRHLHIPETTMAAYPWIYEPFDVALFGL